MEARVSKRQRGPHGLAAALVVLVVLGVTPVFAQDTGNDSLQGKLLQRSDGALFIYKDGLKYPVVIADIGDDAINAVPDADLPITDVGSLFPTPALDAPAVIIVATPTVVPGPYVAVSNPVPGDNLAVGGLAMQGKAFEPSATPDQGSGIDHVQIFLEDRDRGGLHLADARLGLPNPAAAPGSQFALAGWDATVNLPGGSHTLFIYARSWVTGKETAIQVPVRVGGG
jgi:hypothetical protein